MPKLLLSESNTTLIIDVLNSKEENELQFCDVHLKIKNNYIDYEITDKYLTCDEVEWLLDYLKSLLEKEVIKEEEVKFLTSGIRLKPSFEYNEYPGNNDCSVSLDIIIELYINGHYGKEKWIATLNKSEIQSFYDQLLSEM